MKALFDLFYTFFKLGLFTFGGGYAMIPHLKEVVIEKKKWLSDNEVLDIVAVAESTPGPIAINMATYIGFKQKGFWGSVFATVGVILPSFVIIFLISLFFSSILQNQYVSYAFVGIKCGVAFLITKTGIEMLVKMKKKPVSIILFLITLIAMILLELFAVKVSSIFFILFGGIVGLVTYSIANRKNKNKEEKLKSEKEITEASSQTEEVEK